MLLKTLKQGTPYSGFGYLWILSIRFRSDLNQSRSSKFQKRATHHRILRMSQFVGIRNSPSLNQRGSLHYWTTRFGTFCKACTSIRPCSEHRERQWRQRRRWASSLSIWRRIGLHNYCAEQTSSTMLSCAEVRRFHEIPITLSHGSETLRTFCDKNHAERAPMVHQKPSFEHVEARGRVVSRGTKPVQVWRIAPAPVIMADAQT